MTSDFLLPKIYPITDCKIAKLTHLEIVKLLIEGGATFIQIRDKIAPSQFFFEEVKRVIAYARPQGVKIIINDRVDIALAANADGVHLGQQDLPAKVARNLLGPKAIIGYSTHSIEQALNADLLPIDYIAIGPIYPTQTKSNPDPIVGIKEIQQIVSSISKPLVAIGGIKLANAKEILNIGANSVAIVQDLLFSPTTIAARLRSF